MFVTFLLVLVLFGVSPVAVCITFGSFKCFRAFCCGTVYVRRARTNRIFPIQFQRNSTNYHTPTESKVSSKSIKYFQFEYKMNDLQISCSLSGIQFGPAIAGL